MIWILMFACQVEKDCETVILDDSGIVVDTNDTDDTNDTIDIIDTADSGTDSGAELIDADGDGALAGFDCDDSNPDIYPGAPEYCDGIDSNCNGIDDDDTAEDALIWYMDGDSDGFGEELITTLACSQPSGFVADNTDCDDSDMAINPRAIEICNDNIDSDCDSVLDRPSCSFDVMDLSVNIEHSGADLYTTGGLIGDLDRDGSNEVYWLFKEFVNNTLITAQFCVLNPLALSAQTITSSDCDYGFTTDDTDWYNMGLPKTDSYVLKDIDGDGLDDVVMGLNTYNGNEGGVAIITDPIDSAFGTSSAAQIINNPFSATNDSFGAATVFVGDINNDGLGDFGVSAPFSTEAGSNAGAAHLFYGNTDLSAIEKITITGSTNDRLGRDIANGRDINGDGIDDFIVSAQRTSYTDSNGQSQTFAGAGYVFYGPLTQDMASADADQIIYGAETQTQIGYTINTTDDYDGDGMADILMSSHYPNANGLTNTGGAIVITDSVSPTIISNEAFLQVYGQNELDRMGRNNISLGDLNNDGFDDIAISAKETDYGDPDGGSIHIFYGPTSGVVDPLNANAIITGTTNSQFGINMTSGPDIDGDGIQELLIGGHHNTTTAPQISSGLIWGSEL